ncbi:nucleotidyltransferase domain-containing protein [Streptomonospora salina]|uniref:Putative nucleotidyltransferase n=1 Tax=Streptomonospora salina TaxID=104205 RepID=A0A841EKX6_9ACTN|nr:nucleotidyltransferase domain-containing protein [Streptomonospora salina]MBB6000980.1 putative nucleotidyltransferase [Streptomonospora salina]
MRLNDSEFSEHVSQTLAGLNGVTAVSLGGSRATGTNTSDSDWDFAVYYRHRFDPDDLRALDWPGEISEIGGWGGGVFNGGAWLEIDGRHVDIHYRDLDDVEFRIAEARKGRFDVELLPFHRAGIPTYLVVAELALNEVLQGELPRPEFPEELRRHAPERWWTQAKFELAYGRAAYAERGNLTGTAGTIATAATQAAHAVMAARATWVTNEKRLLENAGLRHVDEVLTGLDTEPATLMAAVDAANQTLDKAVTEAGG